MPTTSLKLSQELRQRAAIAAQQEGISPHAFMLQAIERATRAAERRAEFVADALAARDEMLSSGLGYDADEVHAWLKARSAGKETARPEARTWQA